MTAVGLLTPGLLAGAAGAFVPPAAAGTSPVAAGTSLAVAGTAPAVGDTESGQPSLHGSAARVVPVAGTGRAGYGGDGGPAVSGVLNSPSGIAVDRRGDVFVADTGNCRVREVPARSGTQFGVAMRAHHIYTVAGTGCRAHRRAQHRPASLGFPTGVAVDRRGDLFIADASGNQVLELPASTGRRFGAPMREGHLAVVAGTGRAGYGGDGGPAGSALLNGPTGVAVDAQGDVFIADTFNCRVREVAATSGTRFGTPVVAGEISTVAGDGGCGTTAGAGVAGDGMPARLAQVWDPVAVAVDAAGNLLIADRGNDEIREVPVASGVYFGVHIAADHIGTVAGSGSGYGPYLIDGLPATGPLAELNSPDGVAVDRHGTLVVADTYSRAVRAVPSRTGLVFGRSMRANDMYTVAGALPVGSGNTTRWVLTQLVYPSGVAVDAAGDLYVSDQGANAVREIKDVHAPPRG